MTSHNCTFWQQNTNDIFWETRYIFFSFPFISFLSLTQFRLVVKHSQKSQVNLQRQAKKGFYSLLFQVQFLQTKTKYPISRFYFFIAATPKNLFQQDWYRPVLNTVPANFFLINVMRMQDKSKLFFLTLDCPL